MRSLALAALLALMPIAAQAAQLTVTIEGVRNAKGDIRISVYTSPSEWPDHPTRDHDQVLPAKAGRVVFTYDLPPGTYAVNGFHDEIGNGKFKTSLIGLPEEGYLFSNNVRPVLSAPSFQSASFKLPPEGAVISISVQYP
jgi:uncharacterized protein (DUF2141 family)